MEHLRGTLAFRLLGARCGEGHWRGRLSSSALSTAVAAFALDRAQGPAARPAVRAALDWLTRHANADGGWGDTPDSPSNLSTTLLGWSALTVGGDDPACRAAGSAAGQWIAQRTGGPTAAPSRIAAALADVYGRDRSFSAPILAMCALAGRLGPAPACWQLVPALPFELGALSHRALRWLRLPVVSYALPALIAIGQLRHHFAPTAVPGVRQLRNAMRRRTLDRLTALQPPDGGFLEAAPLTAFVTMSLAAIGEASHPAARASAEFLRCTQRDDGSWPIDTDLATWVTTLSVAALVPDLPAGDAAAVRRWLLGQQHARPHPYTGAAPGGWAWTDLPGGVPDADDAAGALLALRNLGPIDDAARSAAAHGVTWLLNLQNRDGGVPTFCRGWGRLAFDRSAPDLTAHALAAWSAWASDLPGRLLGRARQAVARAIRYLGRAQRDDGSWVPLWFGNQLAPSQENPTFGTARVVAALGELPGEPIGPRAGLAQMIARGADWLQSAQQADGAWGPARGCPPSVEETAVAVTALSAVAGPYLPAARRGGDWLAARWQRGPDPSPAPIGLYFASLWYGEQLYPLAFTLSALKALAVAEARADH